MKLHHLVACSLALLLAACAQDEGPADTVCKKIELPGNLPTCPNDAAHPTVTLNTTALTVTPPWACANKGTAIEIQITPTPDEAGTVLIAPKHTTNHWLAGTNSPDTRLISIPVPGDTVPGDYDYAVYMPGTGKCIDPRFRVE
jgi:hypothetical protein